MPKIHPTSPQALAGTGLLLPRSARSADRAPHPTRCQ